MPQDFITMDYLATFTGLVAVVTLITQFTKSIIKRKFPDWAVRLYSLGISWVLQGFLIYTQGNITAEKVGLAILNGFLVALTATGAYETVFDPAASKKKTV